MKLKNKLSAMLGLGLLAALLSGCAGILKNPVTTQLAAEHAAYDTTVLALAKHPEWRKHFQIVSEQLTWLETQSALSVQTVLDLLHRLPVDKLQGPEAILSFDGAALLVQIAGNPELNVNAQESLRLVVAGLAQGIGRRLDELGAVPAATTKSAAKKLKQAKAGN